MPEGKKVSVDYELKPYEFQCEGCEKIHKQSAYCIAQVGMGYGVDFTCDCGHETPIEK